MAGTAAVLLLLAGLAAKHFLVSPAPKWVSALKGQLSKH